MFSGKNSELIRLLVRANVDNRNFLTHDGISSLELMDYDVIGIDEG